MKKRLLSIVLGAALCVSMLAGCAVPTTTGTTDAGSNDSASSGAGKVYYLNFKPEADEQWQDLAKAYTEETGVPVTVVTAASGE